jgi:hypothetical protein
MEPAALSPAQVVDEQPSLATFVKRSADPLAISLKFFCKLLHGRDETCAIRLRFPVQSDIEDKLEEDGRQTHGQQVARRSPEAAFVYAPPVEGLGHRRSFDPSASVTASGRIRNERGTSSWYWTSPFFRSPTRTSRTMRRSIPAIRLSSVQVGGWP